MIRTAHLPPNPGAWADPANAEAWHALRARYLTSTDIPALMGCSSYMTRKKLFKLKLAGVVNQVRQTPQMAFGHAQEAGIARAVADILTLKAQPMREFITLDHPDLPEIGLASTYDWCVLEKFGSSPWGKTPLEVKTCNPFAFIRGYWKAHDRQVVFAGEYVEHQMQTQMIVGGFPFQRLAVGMGTPDRGIVRHLWGYRQAHLLTQKRIWRVAVVFNKELGLERTRRARSFVAFSPETLSLKLA